MEDLIADEDMVVTVTATGYIKRTPLTEYRTQARGGRGRRGMSTKAEAPISDDTSRPSCMICERERRRNTIDDTHTRARDLVLVGTLVQSDTGQPIARGD